MGLVPTIGDALLCVEGRMKAGMAYHKDSQLASNWREERVVEKATETTSVVGAKNILACGNAIFFQQQEGVTYSSGGLPTGPPAALVHLPCHGCNCALSAG